jgi:hypothetical protein
LKKTKESTSLGEFVTNVDEGILAKTHELREWVIRRLIYCVVLPTVFISLGLMLADAIGIISPLRQAWVNIIGLVLGGEGIGSAAGVGFGWLYGRSAAAKITKKGKAPIPRNGG